MKAIYAPKYNRELACSVPPSLKTSPEVVTLWPSGCCTFRCSFCAHCLPRTKLPDEGIVPINMPWEVFLRTADQLRSFSPKVRHVELCGVGEPLVHPRLPEMVEHLHRVSGIQSVGLVTNASLLTEKKIDALAAAQLNWISISVPGVTDESCRRVTGVPFSVATLLRRLEHLYQYRNQIYIYIKTVNDCLAPGENDLFLRLFGDLCHQIFIEYLIPLFPGLPNPARDGKIVDMHSGRLLTAIADACCPTPFQALFILPDGRVTPCCCAPHPVCLGDIHTETLQEIWNGQTRRTFLGRQLQGRRAENPVCAACVQPMMLATPDYFSESRRVELLTSLEDKA